MPLNLKPRQTTPLSPFTFNLESPSPPTDLQIPINQNEPIPPIPPASFIPEKDMYMFGTFPLLGDGEVGKGIIRCSRCGKVGMEWAAGEHRRICNHVIDGTPLTTKKVNTKSTGNKATEPSKKRRASEVSNPNLSPKKRTKLSSIPNLPNSNPNSINGNGSNSNKVILIEKDENSIDEEDDDGSIDENSSLTYKDKSSGLGIGGIGIGIGIGIKKNNNNNETKKKQKEKEKLRLERKEAKEKEKFQVAERKRIRATNPINLDRQCGVINDKSTPCARSLTCKTHTVGAKRSVQGRSRPYDELYLEWQREHNPNFKEPQKREIKDSSTKDPSKLILKKKKKSNNPNRFKGNGGGNEEYLDLDDEDCLKELQDLIGLTKLSCEKVKSNFYNLGSNSSKSSEDEVGLNEKSNNRPTMNGIRSNPKLLTLPITTTTTIPFQNIWKSNSINEFNSVGQLLTKALAARPNKHNHGGHGNGVKNTLPSSSGGMGGQKRNSVINQGIALNGLEGFGVTA